MLHNQRITPRRFKGWFKVLAVGLALFASLTIYLIFLWPWMMRWGATDAELTAPLPGDELRPNAALWSTRAVTIHAPAGEVWRWLLQIGQDRAGFYSYTWLENLFSADIHNTDVIVPAWQERRAGDFIPMARPDLLGGRLGDAAGVYVRELEPERFMIFGDVGTWALDPLDENTTRLIVRDRDRRVTNSLPLRLLWDPAHFVMQRRQLLGIKARAEGMVGKIDIPHVLATVGWVTAAFGTFVLFLRKRWWPWLLIPTAFALITYWPTGDVLAAAAGFIALGLVILGGLAFGLRGWPGFLALVASVLLVLLLSTDAYLTFGLLFILGTLMALTLRAAGSRDLRGSRPVSA